MIACRYDCFERQGQYVPVGSALVFPNGLVLLTLPNSSPLFRFFDSLDNLKLETDYHCKFVKNEYDWSLNEYDCSLFGLSKFQKWVSSENLAKFNELLS